ncbi:MAG TPA: bifunctional rhamnulose-1-phosphate aldolase/short-chain dehydrogenase [Acidimicrobiales bacterium]|nr:bifunctional rhamnulose-1-phosphate aldolase/short-chain dehydrogenase [Acidimicrobiales bacterium]
MDAPAHTEVEALLERSHALGADPRVTNHGGGNTSCKTSVDDPVTGEPTDVLVVKGSGGDLGTLTPEGLAWLRLDRVRAIEGAYRGPEHEDEVVGLFAHCGFGPAGAAPSIDTAMHALLDARHVDHLHPDAVIALAAAADGESLTKECFGREVAWVPWRRPGFELGLQLRALQHDNPGLRGVVLGGHGLTTWADTADGCRATSLAVIDQAERFIRERGRPDPFGELRPGYEPLPGADRHALAARLAPHVRGLCSTDGRVVGRFTSDPAVLDLLARTEAPRLVQLGTSCPDHFLRTKVRPLLLDLPRGTPFDELVAELRELHQAYRDDYSAYYARHAGPDSPPMRGADPAIVLVPGVGMFSFGADARSARIAGEFYLNAVNVMRGAEALSTYAPIDEAEKFRIEYWALEEAKLRRLPPPRPLAGRVALVTGAASGIGKAIAVRLAAEGAAVVLADRDHEGAAALAEALGGADVAVPVAVDVADEAAITRLVAEAGVAYGGVDLVVNNAGLSISKPLLATTAADWDVQHSVMARGSFLVSRETARTMLDQGTGGDIVYVVSKNAVVAGKDNVAYGAAKADQAHQVRLLATELGPAGIRVNGVNPDGVVRGSGIFSGGWGEERAKVYGVPPEELGRFYAGRTLLQQEVLPEHVAAAVFALVGGDLALTTGSIVPVDGGVPMAFVR